MDVILSGRFLDAGRPSAPGSSLASWRRRPVEEAKAVREPSPRRARSRSASPRSPSTGPTSRPSRRASTTSARRSTSPSRPRTPARPDRVHGEAQAGVPRPVARSPRAWRPRRAGTNRPACGRSRSTARTSGTQPGSSSSSTSSSSSRSRSSRTGSPRIPALRGFLVFAGLFVPVWWAWVGYTFYADRFDTDDPPHRVLMIAGMFAVAVLASVIPGVPRRDRQLRPRLRGCPRRRRRPERARLVALARREAAC